MDELNVILADLPGIGRVRLCECNSVHLNIGPITMNLSVEAFAQSASLIHSAMEQLTEIIAARETALSGLPFGQHNRSQTMH